MPISPGLAAGIAAGSAAIGTGLSIAGAAGAFAPDTPSAPNYGQITRDALQAQVDLAPDVYANAAKFDPQYATLQRRIAFQNLFGYDPYSSSAATVDASTGKVLKPASMSLWEPWTDPAAAKKFATAVGIGWRDQPIYEQSAGSAPGYLEMAQMALPGLTGLQNQQRASDLAAVQELGPMAMSALRSYDPTSTALSDRLAAMAGEDLAAGGNLAPWETRGVQQGVRAAQAARGMGFGPSDVYLEALAQNQASNARRQQRMATASQLLGQRQSMYGDPFMQILGRSTGQNPMATVAGSVQPVSQMQVNPAAYGLAQTGYAAQNQANLLGWQGQTSALGGLSSGLGALSGAGLNYALMGQQNYQNQLDALNASNRNAFMSSWGLGK